MKNKKFSFFTFIYQNVRFPWSNHYHHFVGSSSGFNISFKTSSFMLLKWRIFFPGLFNSMYHMLIVCDDLEEFWRFCAYGDLRHIFPIKLSHIPHTLIIFPKREMARGRNALRNRWRARKRKRRRQKGGILPLAAFIPALIVGGKAIGLATAGTGASFAVNKALESASRRRWFSWFIKKEIILPLPNFMISWLVLQIVWIWVIFTPHPSPLPQNNIVYNIEMMLLLII